MDIKNWRRSISTRSFRLRKQYYDAPDQQLVIMTSTSEQEEAPESNNKKKRGAATTTATATWKVLWRKFLKGKKNMLVPSSSSRGGRVHVHAPYDSETYMKNFDEGQNSLIEEPDFVFRSFSMRFADPSKLFPQEDLINLI